MDKLETLLQQLLDMVNNKISNQIVLAQALYSFLTDQQTKNSAENNSLDNLHNFFTAVSENKYDSTDPEFSLVKKIITYFDNIHNKTPELTALINKITDVLNKDVCNAFTFSSPNRRQ